MKRGAKVAVCHDGKWGRRVQGEVVATRRGHHIKVRFPHPESGELSSFWARVIPTVRYNRNKPPSCIHHGKQYKHFGGWADIYWFSVHKWRYFADCAIINKENNK